MNREQIKEKMVSAMDLPKDVIQNASVITILGRNELCIENYRGIIEYTDTLIRVQTRAGQIRIQGKRLRIQYYTNAETKVTGASSIFRIYRGEESGVIHCLIPLLVRLCEDSDQGYSPERFLNLSARYHRIRFWGYAPVSEQIMNYT